MSVSFFNPYQGEPNPFIIYNKVKEINIGLGLDIKYDPESNRVLLWAFLPPANSYIEIVLPYDFDISFFLPQLVELRCTLNTVTKKSYKVVEDYNEILDEMKILIVESMITNNIYNFDNLQLMNEKYKNDGEFIFSKGKLNFRGLIDFMNGSTNIMILENSIHT